MSEPAVVGAARPPLRRQFVGLTGGRAGAALVSAVWLVVAARLLPIRQFGDLALLLALGAIFSTPADLGLPVVLADVVARDEASARAAVALVLRRRLPASAVAAVGIGIAYELTSPNPSVWVPVVFAVSVLATPVYNSCNAALRGAGAVAPEALNELLSRLFVLAVGGGWLAAGGGLLAAVTAYAVADAISAAVVWRYAHGRLGRDGGALDPAPFALAGIAPLAVSQVAAVLYARVDVWVVGVARGSRDVALYAAAYRFLDGLLLPIGSLALLAVPHLASLTGDRWRAAFVRILQRGLALVVPVALVVALTARPLMTHVFGARFGPAAHALSILMIAAPFAAVTMVLVPTAAVRARGRLLVSVSLALVANLAANIVVVPRYGIDGAAAVTAVSEALLAALLLSSLRDMRRHPLTDGAADAGAGAGPPASAAPPGT